jgi:uncharacterized protein (DUF2141 family)
MKKKSLKVVTFLFATFTNLSFAQTVGAETNRTLTVIVDGLRNHNGQVCMRIYSSQQGFPLDDTSEVQATCTQIKESFVTKRFYGLKPGTYAVAVLHDEYGDHKLHKDLLGIPQEGFGISNNPTVSFQTGTPKFKEASFSLRQDKTIRIIMKYSLDK